ncbi:MAG TPA: tRNA pseudouridine(55) synthase TruB [Xanthomonadales bacterium]|nr:tRNA pseudouridine(55) synthase TruB [Xanthomonadales bacterium]
MGRRRTGQDIHGILLLDKPAGLSSNQAVQRVRRLLSARKAGHSGSLDPFATGMLPICLGEATKTAAFMLEARKTYRAVARLGRATQTGDIEGEVVQELTVPAVNRQDIEKVLGNFLGTIMQVPPMYSALKQQGQPLYKLARQGISVERKARQVTIYRLDLLNWEPPHLSFEVHCSKGTYIRTLAEDVSTALGTCGHLVALRRLDVEPFNPADMVTLEEFEAAVAASRWSGMVLPLDAGLIDWPEVVLEAEQVERFIHGMPVTVESGRGMVRVAGLGGNILGLAEAPGDGIAYPKRVFVFSQEP